MSLQTDRIFIRALTESLPIVSATGGRIYSTAVPLPEEEADNVPLPYLVVTFDGLENGGLTKDDGWEGCEDRVRVGVTVVAATRPALASLAAQVRLQVPRFFGEVEADPGHECRALLPLGYALSAQAVEYDPLKPCYWQVLNYQCDTTP